MISCIGLGAEVRPIGSKEAASIVIEKHYLRRRPPISFAFGLYVDGSVVGVITFGVPASRHMVVGACKESPSEVLELNRLWVDDSQPRNTESWFISRAMSMMPPRIILSYADTSKGHYGYVYRAANFNYAGWTDMDRKTPRFDYVSPGKHSRDAFRNGYTHRVRRRPKVKYWSVTGSKLQKRRLSKMCQWPTMSWAESPPPGEGP